jgi:ABC-2 type transport system ATP-binding protein
MKKDDNKPKAAIEVKSVSKHFKLPHERKNSLKQHFVGLFSKKLGYEKFEALKDISFTVNEGDFFGIVGRNGSGKSTLLKIISGIYQPSSGSVKINGTLTPFIELGIGFNPELSGRENVYLNGSILGLSKKQIDVLYNQIVDFAELEKFMDQKLKNYSSGMQVRLAFSIAIRAQNDILLLDEVLAVGDINFQKKCFNYFQELKRQKKTVIFVTHDMNTVKQYCNRGILINDSRAIQTENVDNILDEYIVIMNGRKDERDKDTRTSKGKVVDYNISHSNSIIRGVFNVSFDDTLNFNNKAYIAASIKDNIGNIVLRYHSQFAEEGVFDITKNSILVEVEFMNLLSSGKYSFDFSMLDEDLNDIVNLKKEIDFELKSKLKGVTSLVAINNIKIT